MKKIIILFICLAGCSKVKPVSESELLAYVEDERNGLTKKVDEDGFTITLRYRPSELIAKQQISSNNPKEYDSLKKSFSDYLYFLMEITYNNKDLETIFAQRPSSFASNISYLSDKIRDDIRLITKSDTVTVSDFVYARSYGIGPSQFLFAFEKPKKDQFKVQLKAFKMGIPTQYFAFNNNDFENRPYLKLY